MFLRAALIFVMVISLTWCLRFLLMAGGILLIGDWHWFAFVCSLPGALSCWLMMRTRSASNALRLSLGFMGCVTLLGGFKYFSRDYFLAEFWRVQPGMTERQVERILGKYLKGGRYLDAHPRAISLRDGQSPPQADPEVLLCQSYRHSQGAAWNADWGRVCYRHGIVESTDFSPD